MVLPRMRRPAVSRMERKTGLISSLSAYQGDIPSRIQKVGVLWNALGIQATAVYP